MVLKTNEVIAVAVIPLVLVRNAFLHRKFYTCKDIYHNSRDVFNAKVNNKHQNSLCKPVSNVWVI